MARKKEMEMNMNETIRNDTPEDVVELGLVSAETKGSLGQNESAGPGGTAMPGISEE
jgi:hypothetical protein